MTHKLTADGAAAVAPNVHWIPVGPDTPDCAKMMLINEPSGVCLLGIYEVGNEFWTHWAPLPTFRKD